MIDVSEYQGVVDWEKVHAAGVRRAYIKGGQFSRGELRVDPYALVNHKHARHAGLTVGFYWYADPANGPHRELAAFARSLPFAAGDLPPALDLEVTRGNDWAYLNDWKAQWFAAADTHFGVRCTMYSYYYFLKQMHLYADRPVWGAWYGTNAPPASWAIHQYSSTGHVAGVSGHVDCDRILELRFNATVRLLS